MSRVSFARWRDFSRNNKAPAAMQGGGESSKTLRKKREEKFPRLRDNSGETTPSETTQSETTQVRHLCSRHLCSVLSCDWPTLHWGGSSVCVQLWTVHSVRRLSAGARKCQVAIFEQVCTGIFHFNC